MKTSMVFFMSNVFFFTDAFQLHETSSREVRTFLNLKRPTLVANSAPDDDYRSRKKNVQSSLSAFSIQGYEERDYLEFPNLLRIDFDSLKAVLTTSLMISGGTIGASALVLPEFVAKPGMAISLGIFGAVYIVNLLSGLVIAEVAIKQKEQNGDEVPSSFKEFAETNLDSPSAACIISAISLFTNTCVFAFDLNRAGDITSQISGGAIDQSFCLICFAFSLVILRSTQTGEKISNVSSIAVITLLISFFGLLLPGLHEVQNPLDVLLTPGTSSEMMSGISEAAPILLTTAIYQNIIPSVTKILKYDRLKTVAAISIGSFIPICLFIAWSYACLGGGITEEVGCDGWLYTTFSIAAIIGSSIGCTMSITEELDSFISGSNESSDNSKTLNPLVSLIAVGVPSAAALVFAGGDDFSVALRLGGSYGSPFLYGVIPVAMAWMQRQKVEGARDLVPGGFKPLAVMGMASSLFMLQELAADASTLIV
mmetsp:Transcript_22664/g.33464  ORF Transcript_22664/g.33464 Transcript_22664/m.33464 type:complete len:482 (-) Transcript_22664:38-1483(-)